jgi:SagB-type dehydrogenase family enzyme
MKRHLFWFYCTSILVLLCISAFYWVEAQEVITLADPGAGFVHNKALKEVFEKRMSPRQFESASLGIDVVSSLLWSANGINRPESGKRTAPSALNAQDIDLYLADNQGVWLYQPKDHQLKRVNEGDHRLLVAGSQADFAVAPLFVLLVSDLSRFRMGERDQQLEWAALDAGMVAQNILLFCASEGLACRPRSWMEKEKLHTLLQLNENQLLLLNIPVATIPK